MPTTSHRLTATVLGGASWNTMVYVRDFPNPEPQTLFVERSHRTVGGSGAGKALNLADLGMDVSLWALIGDDAEGEAIRRTMDAAGVRFVTQVDPAGTMRHVNLMNRRGDRISIFENPGTLAATPDTDPIDPLLRGADLIAVTIHEHCRPLLPLVVEAGHRPWIDIHDYDGDNRYHGEFIDAASHLFMSSVALDDWRSFGETRIAEGAQVVVVTHGSEGASGITAPDGWVDVPAAEVGEAVDTNGAGDAFFAGFAVAWIEGRGLESSLHAGAHQAARAIASPDLAPSR